MTAQTTSLEKIIVLDFGSQYNQLITRRIREFRCVQRVVTTTTLQPKKLRHMAT